MAGSAITKVEYSDIRGSDTAGPGFVRGLPRSRVRALHAHGIQPSEMAVTVKLCQQPFAEYCVRIR